MLFTCDTWTRHTQRAGRWLCWSGPIWRPLTNTIPLDPIQVSPISSTTSKCGVIASKPSLFKMQVEGVEVQTLSVWSTSSLPRSGRRFLTAAHFYLHISRAFNSTGQARTNLGAADKKSVEAGSSMKSTICFNGYLKRSSHFLLFLYFHSGVGDFSGGREIPEVKSQFHIFNISSASWPFLTWTTEEALITVWF